MRFYRQMILLLISSILVACASKQNPDPLESINRPIYSFNKVLDTYLLRPVAVGYDFITPEPVNIGITNFFNNVAEVPTIANGVLQLKFLQATNDTGRLAINTVLGVAGIVDVATMMGLERHEEDFGQTLGYWGVPSGAYLMLPFLGPTSIRDGLAMPVDSLIDPIMYIDDDLARYSLMGLRIIDNRKNLLPLEGQLEEALDEYSFIRDAYLQRRLFLVYDGNIPESELEDVDDECFDEEDVDCEEAF